MKWNIQSNSLGNIIETHEQRVIGTQSKLVIFVEIHQKQCHATVMTVIMQTVLGQSKPAVFKPILTGYTFHRLVVRLDT